MTDIARLDTEVHGAARQPDPSVWVVVSEAGPVPFTLRLCGFRADLICGSRDEALAALTS